MSSLLERKCTALAEGVANRWVVGVWVCVNTYWGAVSTSINADTLYIGVCIPVLTSHGHYAYVVEIS
jgi:hypothetical protein